MAKVLVTGCAGYIGSVLVNRLLSSGHKVVGLDSLMYGNSSALLSCLEDDNFEFHTGSVSNLPLTTRLMSDCDIIVLLAALVGAPVCDRYPYEARLVNHLAIQDIVAAASPNQRLLYPNSNSGYGQTDGESFCTEDDQLAPISVYGRTKCAGEKSVLEHANSVVFRLATVFGVSPRMRFDLLVNHFTSVLCCGGGLKIFQPHFKRNFVGIQDVVAAFLFMIDNPRFTGVYNIGLHAANLTKMELAHTICDALNISREVIEEGDGADPDQRNYLVSNEKILQTGFEFRQKLTDGICDVAHLASTLSDEQIWQMRNS